MNQCPRFNYIVIILENLHIFSKKIKYQEVFPVFFYILVKIG